jgi:ribose 5-phosphate isomerase A
VTEVGKRVSGERAAALIEKGMVVGLGTGSTSEAFIHALAARKLDITGVPSSEKTAALAKKLGIKLVESDAPDIYVDGADEIDEKSLVLVKGGGGALLREKLVAVASKRFVVIADATKVVARLGTKMPLPVEVVPFLWRSTMRRVEKIVGAEPVLRQKKDGSGPFVTDGSHYILDCTFFIDDPRATEARLKEVTGVVDTGLFIDIADEVIIADEKENVRTLRKKG